MKAWQKNRLSYRHSRRPRRRRRRQKRRRRRWRNGRDCCTDEDDDDAGNDGDGECLNTESERECQISNF